MHVRSPKHFFTEVEYLAMERASEQKHEYFRGEIFSMAGGSPDHNRITVRLSTRLSLALEGRRCDVFSPDQRVRVADSGLYTYPDGSVACEPVFEAGDTLVNPRLIFEVLSEGTEAFDRGKKFDLYRQLSSLSDYVLVAQDRPRIEHFQRQVDGSWRLEVLGSGDRLRSEALGLEIAVDDVYRGLFEGGV